MLATPFARDGLRAGIAVHLLIERGGQVLSLPTRIEQVETDAITILSPMRGRQLRPNGVGTRVRVEFQDGRRLISFVTTVVDSSGDTEILAMPAHLENTEKRESFRLAVSLRPDRMCRAYPATHDAEAREETVSGTVIDMSEGGVCFVSKGRGSWASAVHLVFTLDQGWKVDVMARVVSVEEPATGQLNARVHCQFTNPARRDREEIARFLIRRQIAMRQAGQL